MIRLYPQLRDVHVVQGRIHRCCPRRHSLHQSGRCITRSDCRNGILVGTDSALFGRRTSGGTRDRRPRRPWTRRRFRYSSCDSATGHRSPSVPKFKNHFGLRNLSTNYRPDGATYWRGPDRLAERRRAASRLPSTQSFAVAGLASHFRRTDIFESCLFAMRDRIILAHITA